MWGMQEFVMGDLSLVLTEVYKNELDVKAFIVKPQEIRKMDVITILPKYHWVANMETSIGEESVNEAMIDISSGDATI